MAKSFQTKLPRTKNSRYYIICFHKCFYVSLYLFHLGLTYHFHFPLFILCITNCLLTRVTIYVYAIQVISPDLPPPQSLTATRFTIGDFDVSFAVVNCSQKSSLITSNHGFHQIWYIYNLHDNVILVSCCHGMLWCCWNSYSDVKFILQMYQIDHWSLITSSS
jgi:hypothetical protein